MSSIEIQAIDGGQFNAYIAKPAILPAPAVIVIQEIFGVNEGIRGKCQWLAEQGYLAIAPDLFWRLEPGVELTDKTEEHWKKAFDLMNRLDTDKAVDDIAATISAARAMEDCTGKAGTLGYCLGGKLAYLSASRTDSDASVGYYGVGLDALLDEAKNIEKPLLLHIAGEDKFVPKEAQEKIIWGLKDNDMAVTHRYEGVDHAFTRVGGEHYDINAAALADERTLTFFAEHLRS